MKILNILLTVFLYVVCIGFTSDCYLAWLSAYESATKQYNQNMAHCESATWASLCRKETNKIYDNSLETAGDAYYDC